MARSARLFAVLVLPLLMLAAGCVGSGKTARAQSIEPLPDGMRIASDTTMGCRDGESGFDYRFVVVGPVDSLTAGSPLLTTLRARRFYHSVGIAGDLPWVSVEYQHDDFPLRAEIGMLDHYLADPVARQGPDPASIPADVRADAEHWAVIAMRPTDFACTTPL